MRIVCSVSLISLAMLVLSGCASTHFQVTGQVAQQPLCQLPGEQASALVFWGPKVAPRSEGGPAPRGAAQRGIEKFFSTSECFAKVKVIRKVGDRESIELPPAEVPGLAATYASDPSHVLFITVRELGPIVKLFSSLALVEGGNRCRPGDSRRLSFHRANHRRLHRSLAERRSHGLSRVLQHWSKTWPPHFRRRSNHRRFRNDSNFR